jgi:hypothetical protein
VFDATYFNTALTKHLGIAGSKSTVEVHLVNAHTHRLRAVLEATPAYVVFDAYRQRVDGGRSDQYWQASTSTGDATGEMVSVIVSYESIAEIVITPAEDSAAPRIGFFRE